MNGHTFWFRFTSHIFQTFSSHFLRPGSHNQIVQTLNIFVGYIPKSLVFHFLLRLPVKSLARFQCIDKEWLSLISDPHFIYTHLKRAQTANDFRLLLSFISHGNVSTTIKFITINEYGLAGSDYSVHINSDSYRVLPSCNGLVCFYGVKGRIYICNPAIRNMVKLPGDDAKGSILLSCGFGFDPQACRYKVIRMSDSGPFKAPGDSKMDIFTMGTCSWRNVKYDERFRFLNRQPPVHASGFFYWITANNGSKGYMIASFDIGNETFEAIPPPKSLSGKNWPMFCLGELGGDLALIDMDFASEGRRRMDLWLLKEASGDENKKTWVKESIIHPSQPLDATRPEALDHGGSKVLLHGFIRGSDAFLNWYNLGTGSFRRFEIQEITSPFFHVGAHVESLTQLDG